MSILVRGKKCSLCGLPIEEGDAVQRFNPFVTNEKDPLHKFSDSTFHQTCFTGDPLAESAVARHELVEASKLASNRKSFIDGTTIDDLADYLPLGYLTPDRIHPLYQYNLANFRRSELKDWAGLAELIEALEAAVTRGELAGRGVDCVINLLRAELPQR